MVEALDRGAAARVALGLVLQRRPQVLAAARSARPRSRARRRGRRGRGSGTPGRGRGRRRSSPRRGRPPRPRRRGARAPPGSRRAAPSTPMPDGVGLGELQASSAGSRPSRAGRPTAPRAPRSPCPSTSTKKRRLSSGVGREQLDRGRGGRSRSSRTRPRRSRAGRRGRRTARRPASFARLTRSFSSRAQRAPRAPRRRARPRRRPTPSASSTTTSPGRIVAPPTVDRHVELARRRPWPRRATRTQRAQIGRPELGELLDVAHRRVDEHRGGAADLGLRGEQVAEQRDRRGLGHRQHEHLAGLQRGHRGVDHQVVVLRRSARSAPGPRRASRGRPGAGRASTRPRRPAALVDGRRAQPGELGVVVRSQLAPPPAGSRAGRPRRSAPSASPDARRAWLPRCSARWA